MDGILCFPPFIRFSETLVLLYVLTYGGTGYGFFCQPLLLNEQILSISKIGHTDKEIAKTAYPTVVRRQIRHVVY